MKTSRKRRFGQRRGDETALAAGVTLLLIAASAGGVYLVGAQSSTHAEQSAESTTRSSTRPDPNAPAPVLIRPAPQHLSDIAPSERYFNSFLGDDGADLGSTSTARNIGIRPDMDERRQGYVVFDLNGGFRTLSTTAGVSDGSPAGTRLLLEILGDGRVLMSQQVKKGADVPLANLDVSGVSELKFVVSNTSTPSGPGDGPEGVFTDPILR